MEEVQEVATAEEEEEKNEEEGDPNYHQKAQKQVEGCRRKAGRGNPQKDIRLLRVF